MGRDGHEGYEAVFRRDYASVLRTVALIVHDREVAAEVTQDAFEELHLRWRRVSGYDRPGAWVRRVAIRRAVRSRDRRTRGRDLERAQPARADIAEEPADLDVRRAVDALPPQQRAAIVLRYYAGLSAAEIGEALGCAEATARVHLHRARARLAADLAIDYELEVDDVAR